MMAAVGMTRDKHKQLQPKISAIGKQAREVWDFCEGWNPERLPVAFAYVQVEDAELVIELLKEIRSYMMERREFAERLAKVM